jgi:AAA15 family ATPase/GTPase
MQLESKSVPLDDILLDPNNYRFRDNPAYSKIQESDYLNEKYQEKTKNFLIGKNRENISDLITSFKKNGYLPIEMIQVRQIKGTSKYIVIEGNRRVAALKELQADSIKGNDIGKVEKDFFSSIPVILYNETSETSYYTLMGLKHIGGNKKWELVNQAELIQDFYNKGYHDFQIAENLGITLHRVRRSLRAFAIIEEYKKSDYKDQFNSSMYNIFDEIATRTAVKEWLQWGLNDQKPNNKTNLERLFTWISKTEKADVDGRTFDELLPVIKTGDDIRLLSLIVGDEEKLLLLDAKEKTIGDIVSISGKAKRLSYISDMIVTTGKELESYINSPEKNKLTIELTNLYEVITKCIDTGIRSHLEDNARLDVTHRIEFKLHSLTIIQFKKFKNLNLKKINKVNIFAGKNNTGKTSVLEAIYLLLKQNNVNGIYDVMSRRAKLTDSIPTKWLASMIDKKTEISGNNDISLSIRLEDENSSDINRDGYHGTIFIDSNYLGSKFESRTILNSIHGIKTNSKEIKEIVPVIYTSPFISHTISDISIAYNSAIEKKGLYDKVIKFLAEEIDNGILQISLSDENNFRRFIVEHRDFPKPFDISQFGEGLQRIFYISLQFAAASGGVLLIDEVENAIHHSLFKSFANFIFKICEEFDVQVFITSHSKEAIDTFVIDKFLEKLSVYHLSEDNGNIVSKFASGVEFSKLINSIGLDLRGEH